MNSNLSSKFTRRSPNDDNVTLYIYAHINRAGEKIRGPRAKPRTKFFFTKPFRLSENVGNVFFICQYYWTLSKAVSFVAVGDFA